MSRIVMASGKLGPFVLKNVQGLDTGEKKASGAYGAVYTVTVQVTARYFSEPRSSSKAERIEAKVSR